MAPGPLLALDHFLARSRRPERLVAASLLLHTTLIAVGVAITGGIDSPLLPPQLWSPPPWPAHRVTRCAIRLR